MLRAGWIVLATFIALVGVVSRAEAANELTLSGGVLKLSEITDKSFAVNTGGLVVVIVRDSGSRPPQNIKVDAPRAFRAIGVVRGTQTDQGRRSWVADTPGIY